MNHQPYIVSLDIGSTQVRAAVAKIESTGNLQILGVGSAVSKGVQKGAIIDIDLAAGSIRQAIENVERMLGIKISEVYVGVSGNHFSLQQSHGVVAVHNEDREIRVDDIERVIQASKIIALPEERSIVEIMPKQFIVDGMANIQDPTGMIGVRLEVDSLIVTGTKTILHNVIRCVERASYQVAGLIYLPLALGETVLTPDEKMLGSVVVDLGGGTMTVVVYHQGHLASTAELPLGGEYITKDIMVGLRCNRQTAEEIKCKYGIANRQRAEEEITFTAECIGGPSREVEYSQVELSMIMEPRIVEMFQLIKRQVELLGCNSQPSGGYVLTGGVMATKEILSIARQNLGTTVRMAVPHRIGAEDPSYLTAISMIRYLESRGGYDIPKEIPKKEAKSTSPQKRKKISPFEKVKIWFSEFI